MTTIPPRAIRPDGSIDFIGDQSMGSKNLTNLAAPINPNDAATKTYVDSTAGDHGLLAGLGDDDHTQYILVAGTRDFSGNQGMGTNRLTGLGAPTADTDAATKGYVDAAVEGLDVKDSVRVATTAGGVLATDFDNGKTVDGIVLATGDRILIKDQATASENGIYTVNASGAPTRANDFATGAGVAGAFCFSEEGTANSDNGFVCTSNKGADVVGTDALSFAKFNGAGSGESNTASNVNVGGVGVFKQKTGVNLEMRGINAGSSVITVTLDAANNEIDIDWKPNNLTSAIPAVGDSIPFIDTSDTNKSKKTIASNLLNLTDHGAIQGLGDDDHSQYILVAGTRAFSGDQSMGSNKITNVATPITNNDAANKAYVDNLINGIRWKASVRVATTAGGTLATSFENTDTVDGIVLATGDRILIKDQATGSENGIYTVNATGAPTRSDDLATSDSAANISIFVEEGTANADKAFNCTNNSGSDVVGTDALVFVQFGAGGGGDTHPVVDTTSLVKDPTTSTKQMRIDVGNIAASTTRVLTMPDSDVVLKKHNYAASTAPTVNDDSGSGYAVGSTWWDTTADEIYGCVDATSAAAVWKNLSGGLSPP